LRRAYLVSVVGVVASLSVFGAHEALALWAGELGVEGSARTGTVAVSVAGDLDLRFEACCPGEARTTIEGASLGVDGLMVDVNGSRVTFFDWVPKADEPSEFAGFRYAVTGSGVDKIVVKAGRDVFTIEGPAPEGSWANPAGVSGPAAKAISHIDVCSDECSAAEPDARSLTVENTGTIPVAVYLQFLFSGPVSANLMCTMGLEITDSSDQTLYGPEPACPLFPGSPESQFLPLSAQLDAGESASFGVEVWPGPAAGFNEFQARVVALQWNDGVPPIPDRDGNSVGSFQDAAWPDDPYGDDDDPLGRGFGAAVSIPGVIESSPVDCPPASGVGPAFPPDRVVPVPPDELGPIAVPPELVPTPPLDPATVPPTTVVVVPPADDAVPPADDAVPPADDAVPPADDAVPPADDAVPPADDAAPPTDDTEPPGAGDDDAEPPDEPDPVTDPTEGDPTAPDPDETDLASRIVPVPVPGGEPAGSGGPVEGPGAALS
jgi:hypothetical protein